MDSRHLAYRRFHAATREIRESRDKVAETRMPDTSCCVSCHRPWADVEEPDIGVVYQYDTSMARVLQCTTCDSARVGSVKMLGVERRIARTEKPIGMRLSMMLNTSFVVTPDDTLHIGPAEAFLNKVKDGELARRGQVWPLGKGLNNVLQLLVRLVETGHLDAPDQGFVCIGSFNRKVVPVMSKLRLSTSLSEVWINDETGGRAVDFTGLVRLRDALSELDLLKKARTAVFWRPIRDVARGQRNESAVRKWMKNTPDARRLLDLLPIDPHDRLNLHQYLTQLGA